MKIYKGLTDIENYEVNFNKICNSVQFKSYISQIHKVCPNGLTVSCEENDDGQLTFFPEIKYYGYDHACNNGSAFSDLGDYVSGPIVSKDIKQSMWKYFEEFEPEMFEKIKECEN